jgi:arylsulfatase A-like enzyme
LQRWIPDDPGALTDLDGFYDHPRRFSWQVGETSDTGSWYVQSEGRQIDLREDGLVVLGDEKVQILSRAVDLAADQVFYLEVEADGLSRDHLRLAWRRSDEEVGVAPRARRWVQPGGGASVGVGTQSYRFHLTHHGAWRGRIEELWLSVQAAPGETVLLRRVAALGRQMRVQALQELAARPLKVELDDEVRDALVVPPGTLIERILTVPAEAELRWAFGLEPEARHGVEFVLAVAEGNEVLSILWSRRLDPHKGEAGRWFSGRQDLSRFGGKRVRFVLETRTNMALEDLSGLPIWAHPMVVQKPPADPPFNVLLISVDTLRSDHLSLYGYPRPTSPHLDAWAKRSAAVFEQTVAAAPWTLPSHVSMLSGLDAVRHGLNHDVGGGALSYESPPFDVLPEILRRVGYRTAAITGGAYLHPSYGFARGFEQYRSWPSRGRARNELKRGVDRSLKFLKQHRETPFFLFLHTYDVHDPYVARRPFFKRVAPAGLEAPPGEIALWSPAFEEQNGFRQVNRFLLRHGPEKRFLESSDRPLIEAFYDSGIAHMDVEISRLLTGLEELGLSQRTIVVLTSDHGEALGEGGHGGHVDLFDRVVLVPLLISWPGLTEGGRRVEEQVRSIDISATLLDGLGLRSRSAMDGVSLLGLLQGRPSSVPEEAWTYAAASNRGLSLRSGGRHKLMVGNSVWPPRGDALYDLRADPQEMDPLKVGEGPGAELRQRLERYFENQATGLVLHLSNNGPGTLRGELKGAMIRPVGTKSVNLMCPCVEWRAMGSAAFEVPAGESYTLHFEKIFGQRLHLRGALELQGERHSFDHTFHADGLEEAAALWFEEQRWQSGGRSIPQGGTGFHLRWQGGRREHGEQPSALDPELRRQLEALGYL